jgi:CHASE2 domain-containing sensor protein/two-component sensor histidine kinase
MKQAWQTQIWRWRYSLIPGLATIAIVGLLKGLGHFQVWEWTVFDQMLRWQPPEPIDRRVLLVGITETDLQRLGAYPVPDRDLVKLLKTLQASQPAVIGVDLFRDLPQPAADQRSDQRSDQPSGKRALTQMFQQSDNIVGIDRFLGNTPSPIISAAPGLPAERVGFADAILDRDGMLRRSLLGDYDQQDQFRYALTTLLAEKYLKTHGIALTSGADNPDVMRFGAVEVPLFHANTGGYVQADAGGIQSLIRFRAGERPFPVVSLIDVLEGRVPPDRIAGKVVIIGMMAVSAKDYVTSNAIASENPSLIYGMEVQAHAVSQILAAVLDRRALIQSWDEVWDYVWIGIFGAWGLLIGWRLRAPLRLLGTVLISAVMLVLVSYGGLILGCWVPIVPALVAFLANSIVLTVVYRYHQAMQLRIAERQEIITLTFNAIHNGPLQTLAALLRQPEDVNASSRVALQRLDRELREIYGAMQHVAQPEVSRLYISLTLTVDLTQPLHELLQQIYLDVLSREFDGFKSLKFKVLKFAALSENRLTLASKAEICRFFEEALCNVGKHAIKPTRLELICGQVAGENRLLILDNGSPQEARSPGLGTKLARKLAKRIKGNLFQGFVQQQDQHQGFKCELIWPG